MSTDFFERSVSVEGTSPQNGSMSMTSEEFAPVTSVLDQLPHEDFDALIDLLATDTPPRNETWQEVGPNSANPPSLRDADGMLDFGKIRTYFSKSSGNRDTRTLDATALLVDIGDAPLPFDGNERPPLHDAGQESQHMVDFLSLSTSPPSRIQGLSSATHVISGTRRSVDVRLAQPESRLSAAHRMNHSNPGDYTPDVGFQGSNKEYPAKSSAILSDQGRRSKSESDRHQPYGRSSSLRADELSYALQRAHDEIAQLRKRCDELTSLASQLPFSNTAVRVHGETTHPTFTEEETESSFVPAVHVGEFSQVHTQQLPADEIRRSLEFVLWVDELVWRRSRHKSTQSGKFLVSSAHSAENIEALRDRLDLWERAVRTPLSS